jgi:hypothetical protein
VNLPTDSAGRPIRIGNRVRWRGQIYTIKAFSADVGRCGTRIIEFEEPLHVDGEVPDELSVDLDIYRQPNWSDFGARYVTCPLCQRQDVQLRYRMLDIVLDEHPMSTPVGARPCAGDPDAEARWARVRCPASLAPLMELAP